MFSIGTGFVGSVGGPFRFDRGGHDWGIPVFFFKGVLDHLKSQWSSGEEEFLHACEFGWKFIDNDFGNQRFFNVRSSGFADYYTYWIHRAEVMIEIGDESWVIIWFVLDCHEVQEDFRLIVIGFGFKPIGDCIPDDCWIFGGKLRGESIVDGSINVTFKNPGGSSTSGELNLPLGWVVG